MQHTVCNPVLETATIKYSVQPGGHFLDDGYFPGTKQAHSGCDINAKTGGNSDYGNRVRAIADGTVIASGEYDTWGGIVLIHHEQLGVYAQYAHLIGIQVKAGQRVEMGDHIGGIGRGEDNTYTAHLHFEIRISRLAPDYWASSHYPTRTAAAKFILKHYVDPEKFLEKHNALRTYDEVMAAREARKAPQVKPAPKPATQAEKKEAGHRVMLYDPATGKPSNIRGKRAEIGPLPAGVTIVINSEEETTWIALR